MENRDKKLKQLSKLLALLLRHKPEIAHIELDKNGYADCDELIKGIHKYCKDPFAFNHIGCTMNDIEQVVRHDTKQRYSFNFDNTKIRANQGHSVNVDVELEKVSKKDMPKILFHGTSKYFVKDIKSSGCIKSMNRLYVHLTTNLEVAIMNGGRWFGGCEPAVIVVDCNKMFDDKYDFYKSKNGVYLTKVVPIKYCYLKKEMCI